MSQKLYPLSSSKVKNPLVLLRHGQSESNQKNLFAGWVDVDLSKRGEEEARYAGEELKKRHIIFDLAFSSALKRAIRTMEIVLQQMNLTEIPSTHAWQLNERHYGSLQGRNRQDVIAQYGLEQVQKWRRDFTATPPLLKQSQTLENKALYKGLPQIPAGESLKDTQKRVLPFWKKNILPQIQKGKSVLIVAHGNSLRSLIKKIEDISDKDISFLEVKTAKPFIYKLDKAGKILSREILDL